MKKSETAASNESHRIRALMFGMIGLVFGFFATLVTGAGIPNPGLLLLAIPPLLSMLPPTLLSMPGRWGRIRNGTWKGAVAWDVAGWVSSTLSMVIVAANVALSSDRMLLGIGILSVLPGVFLITVVVARPKRTVP